MSGSATPTARTGRVCENLRAWSGSSGRRDCRIIPLARTRMNGMPSIQDKVSAAEWQIRVDLAACYRLVAAYGWDDIIFTHITAKLPGAGNEFLINPYGMM